MGGTIKIFEQKKALCKRLVDLVMVLFLLLLMTYEMLGTALHEWLGIGMFVLFLIHHRLNWNWSKNLTNGRYSGYRVLKTLLVVLLLLTMLGAMMSGVVLSRHLFSSLPLHSGRSLARIVHLLCSFWGFVLMSLHLGLHWGIMLAVLRKRWNPSPMETFLLRSSGILIAGYGLYAFAKRKIGSYLMLQTAFVFFDHKEAIIFFFLDYLAIMGLFVFIAYYVSRMVTHRRTKRALQTKE